MHLHIFLFSDLFCRFSSIENKTITGLGTAWGTDFNVAFKAKSAVFSMFQEKIICLPGIHF